MLDFGLPELFLIMAVAVFVIGPKDIPKIMYGFGRIVRRLQYMKFALSSQFEDFMQEHDLTEMRAMASTQTEGSVQSEKDDDAEYLDAKPDEEKPLADEMDSDIEGKAS